MKKLIVAILLFLSLIPYSTANAVNCSCAAGVEVVWLGSTVNQAFIPSQLGEPSPYCVTGTQTLVMQGMSVPAGAMIFVIVHEYSRTVDTSAGGTFSDGVNTYVKGTPINNNGQTLKGTGMYFYTLNSQALSNVTLTYTKVSTDSIVAMSIFYATGIATSSALDTAVTATSYGQTTTSSPLPMFTLTSGTPTQSGEVFIAFTTYLKLPGPVVYLDTTHGWGAQDLTVTAGCAFNMPAAIVGGAQINSGTGTKIYAPTVYGTNVPWAAWILGFKHQ